MPDQIFHPAVAAWFARSFAAPTAAQRAAWPAIQAGRHALIAAPTGSGKTLAAFLAAIDSLHGRADERPSVMRIVGEHVAVGPEQAIRQIGRERTRDAKRVEFKRGRWRIAQ